KRVDHIFEAGALRLVGRRKAHGSAKPNNGQLLAGMRDRSGHDGLGRLCFDRPTNQEAGTARQAANIERSDDPTMLSILPPRTRQPLITDIMAAPMSRCETARPTNDARRNGHAVAAASALFRSACACCSAKTSCRLPSQRLLASHSAESTIAIMPASL